ncbi:MAG: hypothetical protein ACXWCR_12890 [Flavitalea sp.]
MRNEQYINDLLDEYLEQKKSRKDVIFLLQQHGVEDAAEEINLHHAATAALQRYNIIQQVNKVHLNFVQTSEIKLKGRNDSSLKVLWRQPVKLMLRVAAILFIVVSTLFVYTIFNTSSNDIYADTYQAYNVNIDRATFEEIVPHSMVSQFQDKNYAAVIETYKSLTVTNNREKFLTAIAYQETKSYPQAVDLLRQILAFNQQRNSRLYNDEAEFYLGLNLLKLDNHQEALPLFRKIYNDQNHTYNERISKTTLWKIKWLSRFDGNN